MSLSNDYTAIKCWREVIRELPNEEDITTFDRFDVLNRAQNIAQGLTADVVAESYMTDLTPVFDNTGKICSEFDGAGMTWTAATNTLVAPMTTDFASTDVGRMIVFTDTSNEVYVGIIATFVSTTSVTVTGDNLPSADKTLTSVIVAVTTPSGDTLDISAARMMRAGTQARVKLFSTATKYIRQVSDEALEQFEPSSQYELNAIVWNLVGVTIYLDKGDSLSSYGTLTFRYPRLPLVLALDTDYMDVLDGSMMQLTIQIARMLVQRRLGEKTNEKELTPLVQAVYRQFGGEVDVEKLSKQLIGLI